MKSKNVILNYFKRAVRYEELNCYNDALKYYKKILKLDNRYIPAILNISRIYGKLEWFVESIEYCDMALSIDPSNVVALNNKAVILEDFGNYNTALEYFNKALEIDPTYRLSLYNKGRYYEKLEQDEEALKWYDKALKIESRNVDTFISKSVSLQKLKRDYEAIECCDKALELNSYSYVAWTNKGNCLSNLGNDTEAIECHHRALEIFPNFYISWLNKGNSLSNLNRYDEAIECYDKALVLKPNCDSVLDRKSKILESDDYLLNNDPTYINNRSQNYWKMGERMTIFDSFTFEKLYDLEVEGGMGEIFIVYEIDTNNLSIVKTVLISSSYSNEENLSNLRALINEAKILLTIDPHPNIVECSIVEIVNGRMYIFMEYIEGGNLDELICESSHIEFDSFLNIIKQIINGMIHIHKNGLIHRDLKPSNILLSINNNKLIVKVSDFGLSKIIEITDTNLGSFEQKGKSNDIRFSNGNKLDYTKPYAAPEQEDLLEDIEIGSYSDIFSFGIIMVELLTSTIGFKNEIEYYKYFPDIDYKIEEFIRKKYNYVPENLLKIIKKCLSIGPEDRYLSFEDLLQDLNIIKKDKDFQNSKNNIWNKENSKWILYYATRGYSLKRLRYENDAKKQLEKAIQIKPKLISDYINLGLSYFDLGRFEDAISCYNKILKIDPNNSIALNNKRNAIHSIKKY